MNRPSNLQPNVNSLEKLKNPSPVLPSPSEDIVRMSVNGSLQSEVVVPPGTEPEKIQSDVEAPPGDKPVKIKGSSYLPLMEVMEDAISIIKDSKTGAALQYRLNGMLPVKAIPLKVAVVEVLDRWEEIRGNLSAAVAVLDGRALKFLSAWLSPNSPTSLREIAEMNLVRTRVRSKEFNDTLVTAFESRAARAIARVWKTRSQRRALVFVKVQAWVRMCLARKRYSAAQSRRSAVSGKIRPLRAWEDPYADIMRRGDNVRPTEQNEYIVFSLSPDIEICFTGEVKRLIKAANSDPTNTEKKKEVEAALLFNFQNSYLKTCNGRRQFHVVSEHYIKAVLGDENSLGPLTSLGKPKLETGGNTFADLDIKCAKDLQCKQKACDKSYSMRRVIDFYRICAVRFRDERYGSRVVQEVEAIGDLLEKRLIDNVNRKNKQLAAYCPTPGCPCANGFLRPYDESNRRHLRDPPLFTECPNQGCPHAHSAWCTECGPDHTDPRQLCDFQRILDNHPERESFLQQIKDGALQQCPHCRYLQGKSSGCDRMQCGKCQECYCHSCGGPIDKGGDYLATHLISLSVGVEFRGTSMPCRKQVVKEAMKGNEAMVDELMKLNGGLRQKVIDDVAPILESMREDEYETIPVNLVDWVWRNAIPEQRERLGPLIRH